MDLFKRVGGREDDPVYRAVEYANLARLQTFVDTMIDAALLRPPAPLSHSFIRALNFQAIAGLLDEAGQYRQHDVTAGSYTPPSFREVQPRMDNFLDVVSKQWSDIPPVSLAAFVLWHLNHIHPFPNGNGRTARALCYYVLCVKLGVRLPGTRTVPEVLRMRRPEYIEALKKADGGDPNPIIGLVSAAVEEQIGLADQGASR